MLSVSDDDVRKRLTVEKPRFELAAKDVFRLHAKMLHLLTGRSTMHSVVKQIQFVDSMLFVCLVRLHLL